MRYVLVRGLVRPLLGFLLVASLVQAQAPRRPMNYDGNAGGVRYLEEGQPPAIASAKADAAPSKLRAAPRLRLSRHAYSTKHKLHPQPNPPRLDRPVAAGDCSHFYW